MLKGQSKWFIIFVAVLSSIYGLFNSVFVDINAMAVDKMVSDEALKFVVFLMGVIIIWIVEEFATDCSTMVLEVKTENTDYDHYFNRLYNIKSEVLRNSNTGYISGLLSKLTEKHKSVVLDCAIEIPPQLTFIIYYSIKMFSIDIRMGILFVAIVVFGVGTAMCIQAKYVVAADAAAAEIEGERSRLFVDAVSNIDTVQKMKADNLINSKASVIFKECQVRGRRQIVMREFADLFCKLFTYMTGPIMFLVYMMVCPDMGFYELAVIGVTAGRLPFNVKAFLRIVRHVMSYRASLGKLEDICKEENSRNEYYKSSEISKLEIRDLEYSYLDKSTDSTIVINIPKFEVNKGEFVCIIGESGQGKTTLLNILSGRIETNNVYVNGCITDKEIDCSFISQDVEVLDMSLKDNILLSSSLENRHEDVMKMLYYIDCVGLGEWYDKQPDGVNTILGERGVFVSAGQRQRINLIRGLFNKADVYLLDEPTSAVDDETEEKIISLIEKELVGKTIVCVTHRPAILRLSDRRYSFENGSLKEI